MTMTKRSKTSPSNSRAGLKWAKATKLIVAPFSTNSTPMSMPMALRLVAMHTAPQTNSSAPSKRYWFRLTMMVALRHGLRDGSIEMNACQGSIARTDSCEHTRQGVRRPEPFLRAGEVGGADEDHEQVNGDNFKGEQITHPAAQLLAGL